LPKKMYLVGEEATAGALAVMSGSLVNYSLLLLRQPQAI
jgi:hypothetical protein